MDDLHNRVVKDAGSGGDGMEAGELGLGGSYSGRSSPLSVRAGRFG